MDDAEAQDFQCYLYWGLNFQICEMVLYNIFCPPYALVNICPPMCHAERNPLCPECAAPREGQTPSQYSHMGRGRGWRVGIGRVSMLAELDLQARATSCVKSYGEDDCR